jgi:hypothetical protein
MINCASFNATIQLKRKTFFWLLRLCTSITTYGHIAHINSTFLHCTAAGFLVKNCNVLFHCRAVASFLLTNCNVLFHCIKGECTSLAAPSLFWEAESVGFTRYNNSFGYGYVVTFESGDSSQNLLFMMIRCISRWWQSAGLLHSCQSAGLLFLVRKTLWFWHTGDAQMPTIQLRKHMLGTLGYRFCDYIVSHQYTGAGTLGKILVHPGKSIFPCNFATAI